MNLTSKQQRKDVGLFYMSLEKNLNHLLHVMTRESSIQLVFQLCIMLHQFDHVPAEEVIYSKRLVASLNYPTFLWIAGHFIQVISLLLSAYSTVSVPVKHAQLGVFIHMRY